MSNTPKTEYSMDDLLCLMSRLRTPDIGCPWDLKQNYQSITASTLEEAYEVVDAIERKDYQHLKEELGDYVFQAVFYAQLATEDGFFSFKDIVSELTAKLIRRHPHVFPDGHLDSYRDPSSDDQEENIAASWEAIKAEERKRKGQGGVLDDVPKALPALPRAAKLQKRAAKVGFDWNSAEDVVAKVKEELAELEEAMAADEAPRIEEELGDLLFTCANLSRKLGLAPESVLRQANGKFEKRFNHMEVSADRAGESFESLSLSEKENYWNAAKKSGL